MNFRDLFSRNIQISNLIKIRLVEAELLHVDGRTDGPTDRWPDRHDEANSRFSKVCERRLKLTMLEYFVV